MADEKQGEKREIKKGNRVSSEILGKNIKKKRIEQNISQEYVAEMLDISRQSVSKWENGLSEPSTKNLTQLANILNCDITELLAEEVQEEASQSFAVVGVAVEGQDIRKMKRFCQEMPSDAAQYYDARFVVICDNEKEINEIYDIVKLNNQQCTVMTEGDFLAAMEPNMVYITSREIYGGSFDDFFEEMVKLYGKNTVAVLMSEEGEDGTKGVRQVKRAGGMSVLCEAEGKSKRYWNSSPDSFFDYVLEPFCMGYWIARFVRKKWFKRSEKYGAIFSERYHHRIEESLQTRMNNSLMDFKEEYLIKALFECIDDSGLSSADHYIRLLENSESEQQKLVQSITKYVWPGKRDWRSLRDIQDLLDEIRPELNGVRIWVAGCGNGLEAYVVAMLIADYMGRYEINDQIKIFATDVDENVVSGAVRGIYDAKDIEGLPDDWIKRYFRVEGTEYRLNQAIRNMVIFSVHDILTNSPFARINMLICRNVMEKYRIRSRKTMMSRFSYSIVRNGYLMLGQNEDMAELNNYFQCLDEQKGRIWRKKRNAPSSLETWVPDQEAFSVGKVVQELIISSTPSCIIVDENYEILYTGKGAGKYLQFKSGFFSKNLFDNIDIRISVLIDTALKYLQEGKEWQETIPLKSADGRETDVNIHVLGQIIRNRRYYMIWFEEQEAASGQPDRESFRKREERLERELEMSQNRLYEVLKELDSTKDKYELINEKLQSTNEELILMNDELQMVNQELAASNRKLTRVNTEYQKKINEIPRFIIDGIDFMGLLDLKMIFLDREMRIKKISPGIPEITNIRESDLNEYIGNINLMNGYLGWTDDVESAREGNRIYRVINVDETSRYVVELCPYEFKEDGQKGCIILIQKIEKGGEKQHGTDK